jgi:dienelactone hydrolase
MGMSAGLVVLVSLWVGCDGAEFDSLPPGNPVPIEKATVHATPVAESSAVPKRYHLPPVDFDYELTLQRQLPASGLDVFAVRFPSPVKSRCIENNTVYAEYYRPRGSGPFPGVIVLDITAGDQSLSRMIANCFAQNRIAALFVQMAYYGPRRPEGSKLRLLSTNVVHTGEAIRQTVLDVRRATAWLAARSEIDSKRLGIHGTSLGSMIGALSAEMEPKLARVSIALGGGGLVDYYYDDPRAAPYRKVWEAVGGSKKLAVKLLAPVDPLTYGSNLKGRKVLMIAGRRDDIVPPQCTEALWKAAGEPKIVWYDCTHYGAALYVGPMMQEVVKHFNAE